jgi:hypothetical protein
MNPYECQSATDLFPLRGRDGLFVEPPNISITVPTIALDTFSMVSYGRDEQVALRNT